jgi:hypothetical protein
VIEPLVPELLDLRFCKNLPAKLTDNQMISLIEFGENTGSHSCKYGDGCLLDCCAA